MEWQTTATVLPTAISSTLYLAILATFLWSMARRGAASTPAVRPWVSILKPVAGADEALAENLESFANLDYPAYEIIFGAASAEDPALPIVSRFLAAHPEIAARIVITGPPSGAILNPKVAQLAAMTQRARGSVLVVSDANVRVPRGYLRSLIATLLRPGVGLVSSLIVGTGERSLGAALENAQLGVAVAPLVVAAYRLAGRPITVGKSMAMRRADLERVGGWESVGGVLAEDDVLGKRFHDLGYGVEICLHPVENRNLRAPTRSTLERHSRWAKMRRGIIPVAFRFEPLLMPFVIATMVALIAPSPLAARLAIFALGLQITGALLCHAALGARRPLLLAAIEPARAAVALTCWSLACASRRVSWRGHAFLVGAGSALTPVAAIEERAAPSALTTAAHFVHPARR